MSNLQQDRPSTGHSLRRTSPKGERFLGTCVLCGLEDVPLTAMSDECPNPAGVTRGESLLKAMTDEPREQALGDER